MQWPSRRDFYVCTPDLWSSGAVGTCRHGGTRAPTPACATTNAPTRCAGSQSGETKACTTSFSFAARVAGVQMRDGHADSGSRKRCRAVETRKTRGERKRRRVTAVWIPRRFNFFPLWLVSSLSFSSRLLVRLRRHLPRTTERQRHSAALRVCASLSLPLACAVALCLHLPLVLAQCQPAFHWRACPPFLLSSFFFFFLLLCLPPLDTRTQPCARASLAFHATFPWLSIYFACLQRTRRRRKACRGRHVPHHRVVSPGPPSAGGLCCGGGAGRVKDDVPHRRRRRPRWVFSGWAATETETIKKRSTAKNLALSGLFVCPPLSLFDSASPRPRPASELNLCDKGKHDENNTAGRRCWAT